MVWCGVSSTVEERAESMAKLSVYQAIYSMSQPSPMGSDPTE